MSGEGHEGFPKIFNPDLRDPNDSDEMKAITWGRGMENMGERVKYRELIDRVVWHEFGEQLKKDRENGDINFIMQKYGTDDNELVRFMRYLDEEESVGPLLEQLDQYVPHVKQSERAQEWLAQIDSFYSNCDAVLSERESKIPDNEWNSYIENAYAKWEEYKKNYPAKTEEADKRIAYLKEAEERRRQPHIRKAA